MDRELLGKVVDRNTWRLEKRNMFDESVRLSYCLPVNSNITYGELYSAVELEKDTSETIEINEGEIYAQIPMITRSGKRFNLLLKADEVVVEENDTRWIIEWYEGVWVKVPNEDREYELKKKGFIHREVFFTREEYTFRLSELAHDDENSPIIVGTYECEIVNNHPKEADL